MPADSFGAAVTLTAGGSTYRVFRLDAIGGAVRLPYCLKVLLENLLRNEDGHLVTAAQIQALAEWDPAAEPSAEIAFTPARVLLQDFTGVPCLVDLAAMREAMAALGGDTSRVSPLRPAELIIDHSVIADFFGRPDALERNIDLEYRRNAERYAFLRWGQQALPGLRVVPPGTGICHQVNIEHLARVVFAEDGAAFCDTLVGTDSHTPMVNGLGVLGWGVGGIEAEAAMLGQPLSMLIPKVIGVRLSGELPEGTTATDLVLTIAELLRSVGVVGTFVEFFGPGVAAVPVANRATIGNMSPEYGCTSAIFPIDEVTLAYLRLTGRPEAQVALVEAYAREQGLWHDPDHVPAYSRVLDLDLAAVVPSIAGPKRPQDRIPLARAPQAFRAVLGQYAPAGPPAGLDEAGAESFPASDPIAVTGNRDGDRPATFSQDTGLPARPRRPVKITLGEQTVELDDGAVVIAADHFLHQHLQPRGDDRRRAAGEEGRRTRPRPETVGEDLAGAGLAGGHGLLRPGRADPVAGQARLQPGRLRLHHLHRQLRAADPRGLRRHRRRRSGGVLGAVREPQLRGPHPPRDQAELPGLTAAGGRLRPGRHHGHRPDHRPAGHRQRRAAGLAARYLAVAGRDRRGHRLLPAPGHVHPRVRGSVRRGRAVAVPAGPGR
jgi:aconitate hydratase